MIQEVMQYINNYFVKFHCGLTEIQVDGLIVDDPSDFVVGQYVLVLESVLNDGVYKITGIEGNKLLFGEDVVFEVEDGEMIVCGLAVPKAFLALVDEIVAYNTKNSGNIKSESLGDYSVTYNGDDDVSWISAFRKRLQGYRVAYLNLPRKVKDYVGWYR